MKRRILFIGEAITFAHIVRPLLLANTLNPEEYEIFLAFSDTFDGALQKSGVIDQQGKFLNPHFNREYIDSRTIEEFVQILIAGKELFDKNILLRYAEADCALINKVRPDIVVGDMRLSLSVSAAILQVPYVCVTNAYWSPNALMRELPLPSYQIVRTLGLNKLTRGRFSTKIIQALFGLTVPLVFRYQAKGLDEARRHYGLPVFPGYLEGFTNGDMTVFADSPTVAPVRSLGNSQRYVGPVCWSPQINLPSWWNELNEQKPLVYISLGSSGEMEILRKIISGVSELDVQVVLSTGGREIQTPLPNSVYCAEYLPGDVVARRASVVISNGGSPTSYQSLAQGTPVIGVASNMDQLVCMTNLSLCNAGLLLRADNISAVHVREAVETVLSSSRFSRGAEQVAQEFEQYDVSKLFPQAVADLASTRHSAARYQVI